MIGSRGREVFTGSPSERALARPRHLAHEGRVAEAAQAYRAVLTEQPNLDAGWVEWFQLVQHQNSLDAALALAHEVEARGGRPALGRTLAGSALVEHGRHREGLAELERALATDPDFAPVWHELGRAAFRLGENARALLALDRAFALEPRPETLYLRGRVLRAAGRYAAAEVAFEGAGQTAEYPEQRSDAETELAVTRRFSAFGHHRPDQLEDTDRWFAETGGVPLTRAGMEATPTDDDLLAAFEALCRDEGWQFTELVRTDDWPGWSRLAAALDLPVRREIPNAAAVPLVVGTRPDSSRPEWAAAAGWVGSSDRGLTFVLIQPEALPPADVAGVLDGTMGGRPDPARAARLSRHAESRLQGRGLGR
jgi:tetratricopeptide (TPR) repeat protein